MGQLIAAIDQGTTSTRCILLDHDGPVASAQKEHRQIYPRPGWVEHDPLEIWTSTQQVISDAIRSASAQPQDISAVGITNQRETIVAWDRNTGRPYCNAIVWQDTRTREICDALASRSNLGIDRFREMTGLPIATYFSAPRIRWLLENCPDFAEVAQVNPESAAVGTIDSWLVWNLTGGANGGRFVTDVTNASRTMLMNLRTLRWDDSLLDAFGVPRAILPRIVPSSDRSIGKTRRDGPFAAAIPIAGILGDQQSALVGQTCFQPGESKNTYGTGCFLLLNTGAKLIHSKAGLLTTLAYQFAGQNPVYALEGSIAVTGALVQWFRDNLGLVGSSSEIESLAASVPDNGGVYIVPAFSGLFAPYWRSDARGIIAGLTRHSNKAHLARAVLEATAFQVRDVVEAMQADSGTILQSLKVDGGMAVNELLMQFQADILGVDVVRPKITETTSMGAAFAAGLATGFWRSIEDLKTHCAEGRRWSPAMSQTARAALCAKWQKAVERSLDWL